MPTPGRQRQHMTAHLSTSTQSAFQADDELIYVMFHHSVSENEVHFQNYHFYETSRRLSTDSGVPQVWANPHGKNIAAQVALLTVLGSTTGASVFGYAWAMQDERQQSGHHRLPQELTHTDTYRHCPLSQKEWQHVFLFALMSILMHHPAYPILRKRKTKSKNYCKSC